MVDSYGRLETDKFREIWGNLIKDYEGVKYRVEGFFFDLLFMIDYCVYEFRLVDFPSFYRVPKSYCEPDPSTPRGKAPASYLWHRLINVKNGDFGG